MWLIDTTSLELKAFQHYPTNSYAILSHRWGSNAEELTFEEFRAGHGRQKLGFEKIRRCCLQAQKDGLQYAWVDTCCIDKRSSTELSEAINSMFQWYKCAKVCYVFLADVHYRDPPIPPDGQHPLTQSDWFERGWTLQELVAPQIVSFYNSEWTRIGDRADLAYDIYTVTKIPFDVLTLRRQIPDCSIAQRMSWAATRKTTRTEDLAYCLLDLFNVNMPLLYGEESKAFLRLQETIIEQSDDETIFAWTGVSKDGEGLLAPSPVCFKDAAHIKQGKRYRERPPYKKTNRGLEIECQLLPCALNTYLVPLQCAWVSNETEARQIAIFICRTSKDYQYRRVPFRGKCVDGASEWELPKAKISTIFVPNDGRGLELMPHSGLPRIIIESNLHAWHFSQNRVQSKELLQSSMTKTEAGDLESCPPKSEGTNHSDLDLSTRTWHKTTRIQQQTQDLEHGDVFAFTRSPVPGSLFYYHLQIGFDMEFRPICNVQAVRCYNFKYGFGFGNFLGRGARAYFRRSFWRSDDFEVPKPPPLLTKLVSGRHEVSVPEYWADLSVFQGSRIHGLEGRIGDASPFSHSCRQVEFSLRPQHELEWRLRFNEKAAHSTHLWNGHLCLDRRLHLEKGLELFLWSYLWPLLFRTFPVPMFVYLTVIAYKAASVDDGNEKRTTFLTLWIGTVTFVLLCGYLAWMLENISIYLRYVYGFRYRVVLAKQSEN